MSLSLTSRSDGSLAVSYGSGVSLECKDVEEAYDFIIRMAMALNKVAPSNEDVCHTVTGDSVIESVSV